MEQEEKYISDEVNLMDYVKIVLKRKVFILVLIIASVAAAGVFTSFSEKVYRLDLLLEIGESNGEVIENPTSIAIGVEEGEYKYALMEEAKIAEKDYPEIKTENPKNTRFLEIMTLSSQPDEAKNLLEKITQLILANHQNIIKVKTDSIEGRIRIMEEKINLTENDIERVRSKIVPIDESIERIENKIIFTKEEKENLEAKVEALQEALIYRQDLSTYYVLFDSKEKLADKKKEIEDLYLMINSLKSEKEDFEMEINALKILIEDLNSQLNSLKLSKENIEPTEIIKDLTISEKSVSPRPIINMAIAGVLGLMVGIFWAIGREWWQETRTK